MSFDEYQTAAGLVFGSYGTYLIGFVVLKWKMVEKRDFVTSYQKPKIRNSRKWETIWYVYNRFSKYDPEIKHSRKVSAECLASSRFRDRYSVD